MMTDLKPKLAELGFLQSTLEKIGAFDEVHPHLVGLLNDPFRDNQKLLDSLTEIAAKGNEAAITLIALKPGSVEEQTEAWVLSLEAGVDAEAWPQLTTAAEKTVCRALLERGKSEPSDMEKLYLKIMGPEAAPMGMDEFAQGFEALSLTAGEVIGARQAQDRQRRMDFKPMNPDFVTPKEGQALRAREFRMPMEETVDRVAELVVACANGEGPISDAGKQTMIEMSLFRQAGAVMAVQFATAFERSLQAEPLDPFKAEDPALPEPAA